MAYFNAVIIMLLVALLLFCSGCATKGELQQFREDVDEMMVNISLVMSNQEAQIRALEMEIEGLKWTPVEWQRPTYEGM